MSWAFKYSSPPELLGYTREKVTSYNAFAYGPFWYKNMALDLKVGEAIEPAWAAVFLASDESSYITATVCFDSESFIDDRISWLMVDSHQRMLQLWGSQLRPLRILFNNAR